jgi:hypothetical protein
MATSNKIFVSPGVYTSERDLSFVAQSVGVTTLGIVGETLIGPAFEPIFITSFDEFQTFFGGTSPEKFINTQIPKYEAAYIAKAYLQQSNQLFVTRILGLSGYDAGPSWSIRTVANVDTSTIGFELDCTSVPNYTAGTCDTTCVPVELPFSLTFSGCVNQLGTIGLTSNFPSVIQNIIDNQYEQFDGGVSTLRDDIYSQIYGVLSDLSTENTSIYYYGTISESDYDVLSPVFTGETNVFNVASLTSANPQYTASTNDSWYYALFENNNGSYSGFSYWTVLSGVTFVPNPVTTTTTSSVTTTTTTINPCLTTTTTSPSTTTTTTVPVCYSGTVVGKIYYYTGTSYSDYDNVVIATLRSRGESTYNSTNNGPSYEVTGATDVIMNCSGTYSSVKKNPYATFEISGVTKNGTPFSFETSLQASDAKYISKVFGLSNFQKPKNVVPLFVEESYQTLLNYAYRKGFIRGLNCSILPLPEARDLDPTSIAWYLERYQSPASPFLVSELRGNKVYNLFRFVTISDGNAANTQVKVTIQNISFDNNTFDVVVRDFFDEDSNPVVVEKFTNCNMNPATNNFVAKKIGTTDGEFALLSKYIMVEMNEDAPVDALPCGFEGYTTREYAGCKSPFPIYKTKYDFPGEVIYNPPFGTALGNDDPTRSPGDKVRKTYLGFSTDLGYDVSFFEYKGKVCPTNPCDTEGGLWAYKTQGFHMDKNASGITIPSFYVTSGQPAFACGVSTFTSDPESQENAYYFLYSRKFTVCVAGGFDGWDEYREFRTNGDGYVLGGTNYLQGANPDCSTRYTNATGWGSFKQIAVEGNTQDFANTDYYAYLLGMLTFSNPEAVNINVFVTPGIDYVNNSNLVEDAIQMIEEDRADSIYICTTPDYNMFAPTLADSNLDMIYPQEAVDNLANTGIDSNYTATYYPWVLTRDSVNNTQVYIPATAEVTRNLALTDNIAFPWFASAGYTRGLVNAIKARRKLTQEDRDTLYKGRINPIATFSDVGTVIWGNKTLQIRESALDRINVRRLLLQARKLISAVAVRLLFEQNEQLVRQQFLDSVNPILDSIRRDRGLYDFRVTVSSDPEDLDRNQLVGKIYIKPTKALEFIDIEFLITPTGASFENI